MSSHEVEAERPDHLYLRVVALSCSPSHGWNSDTMLDHFIMGIEEVPEVYVDKVYLSDVPMKPYSFDLKGGPAPDEKEFSELCENIQRANGLVIATPTYNFSVPAGLKNFIDRIRFFALDFKRQNRMGQPVGRLGYLRTFYLVSGGTPTWAEKLLFFAFPPFWLRSVFLYYGAHCLGALYTGNVKACKDERLLMKCRKRGRRYAKYLHARKTNGILERIFWRPPQQDYHE
ncbi:MAG: hypothetical protein COV91_04090 [Candidatus Taylorbacteria bacterium CG11_big_fil_rev_8_21_14_0_20_46_11]|uniref:NADPH-dependent FMN reductase-like domain-containing protein n=1 Tax=Candidatus Taylorbacteria bacterium CG11_big_fil_rev_8_21_14_0_20_46_11 TaxID=1975025 RepID=A0A2H0KB43_9BACT|nr:MAG: hypothetical protein COV91_04090 [Candidatus Taylorbacteria bacterium CG11_big_fil_rev_8_21_14_0_20_46_11]